MTRWTKEPCFAGIALQRDGEDQALIAIDVRTSPRRAAGIARRMVGLLNAGEETRHGPQGSQSDAQFWKAEWIKLDACREAALSALGPFAAAFREVEAFGHGTSLTHADLRALASARLSWPAFRHAAEVARDALSAAPESPE